jgi:uncharacterized repeat protein (TIGR04076 family)
MPAGTVYYVRNAMLEMPPGVGICIFALSSILPAMTGAMLDTDPGGERLNLQRDWQCPEPETGTILHIENVPPNGKST